MKPITGNVRCSGKKHRISITPGGPVTLHDHTRAELAAERILVALGGEHCRCMQILQAWRKRTYYKVPLWARAALKSKILFTHKRRMDRQMKTDPFVSKTIRQRFNLSISNRVLAAILQSDYRHNDKQWVSLSPVHIASYSNPQIFCSTDTYNGLRWLCVTLNFLHWYRFVYKRGLAVVDGKFILSVISKDATGYIVLTGRQNADLSIDTIRARISVDATGAKTLTWLDDAREDDRASTGIVTEK